MLKQNYVVYRHRNNATNEIFYVGSGSLKRSGIKRYKTDVWKNIVSKDGYTIEIVSKELSLDDSLDLEYLMIDSYGTIIDEDGHLVNIKRDRHKSHLSSNVKISLAQSGNRMDEKTKAKISKANLGKKCSEETIAKISLAQSGEKGHMFGKTHSEKTKAKMSLSKSGENHPLFGKRHSEETKAKMSLSKLGENNPLFGKKISEETKSKTYLSKRRKSISDKNYELLLEDFSKIDKVTCGVTYRKLCIKYNLSYHFVYGRFLKYKNK